VLEPWVLHRTPFANAPYLSENGFPADMFAAGTFTTEPLAPIVATPFPVPHTECDGQVDEKGRDL